ncbi:uncharacterized protein LOC107616300 [Arachis ipaensis]|uniref:uncharacterized protein LOC107616300 n=1 Tax=Arachis ipaensis TaxID=130454 RepID=UPI0007AF8737|nr:uncharacterized protein LOC107616300 [Arachis ipaensis]
MADKENPQLSQDDLLAQIVELQAEVRRIAEFSTQNNGENSKGSAQSTADPLNIVPPKEKLTLDNPFSEEITNYQMLKNFTLPTALEPYKGFGDPRAHVKKFQSMMFFNGPNNEPVLCRAFPVYLDGAALLWFSKLSAGSISSFEDLARSFIDYFAASRIYVHGSDFLGTIKQGQHESLKDYMTRFADATMEIQDLDPAVHLHALKAGLRPGKFRETIAITKPKTLEEFRERAAGQMEIEESSAEKQDRHGICGPSGSSAMLSRWSKTSPNRTGSSAPGSSNPHDGQLSNTSRSRPKGRPRQKTSANGRSSTNNTNSRRQTMYICGRGIRRSRPSKTHSHTASERRPFCMDTR